jgi:sugar O-acyltransferase (sialic acid O-acetyltransferase NeuD family)
VAEVVVFGTGAIAKLAHHYFTTDSEHQVVAFTVDGDHRTADTFLGLPLVSFEEVASHYPPPTFRMFVAVSYAGMNKLRAEKYRAARGMGYQLVSYVSSRCSMLTGTPPGDNCFILEDNTIQPFVSIGSDVTLWSGNHIGHDSTIEDHCFISSHVVISGNVTVHPYCFLGVNATVGNGVTIAARTLIAAGALILKDTVEGGVYVTPGARLISTDSDAAEL